MNTVSITENRTSEKIQFRILFAISYMFLFIFVLINRVMPKKSKFFVTSDCRKSIFRETRELVYSAIPIAFMN